MKRKWYQFETVIKFDCDTCQLKKFREEFNQACVKSYKEMKPIHIGLINLPDGTSRNVSVSVME